MFARKMRLSRFKRATIFVEQTFCSQTHHALWGGFFTINIRSSSAMYPLSHSMLYMVVLIFNTEYLAIIKVLQTKKVVKFT